jgi:hypothetical protein
LESYVLTAGTREHRRKLRQLIKTVARTGQDISIAASDEVVRSNRNAFYLHVMHTLHHRGNSVKLQIFYMSLLWRHKGVSRSGIELMSHLNLGMALRTLDEYRERETRRQTEYTRYICEPYCIDPQHLLSSMRNTNFTSYIHREMMNRPNIQWWDNFNKNIAIQMQGVESGAYKPMNWCGKAIHVWRPTNPGSSVTLKIDSNADNVWSAMSEDLFEKKDMDTVRKWMKQVDDMGSDLYDMSVCVKYDVRRVPLKPDSKKALVFGHKQLAKALNEHRDGMQDFFPMQIEDINIGSWTGLLTLLKNWSDDRQQEDHYSILNTDCNIFLRIMKVPRTSVTCVLYVNEWFHALLLSYLYKWDSFVCILHSINV